MRFARFVKYGVSAPDNVLFNTFQFLTEPEARDYLAEIERRSPESWVTLSVYVWEARDEPMQEPVVTVLYSKPGVGHHFTGFDKGVKQYYYGPTETVK